jgi:hypothetical protein
MLNNQYTLTTHPITGADRSSVIVSHSLQRYQRSAWKARVSRLVAKLLGNGRALLNLAQVVDEIQVLNRRYLGIRSVDVRQITGSEGRTGDFDADFNPLSTQTKDRWISIANARQLGTPLPPVELIKVGEAYFVRDGHHRLSVARAFGERFIDAEVVEWVTPVAISLPASRRSDASRTVTAS